METGASGLPESDAFRESLGGNELRKGSEQLPRAGGNIAEVAINTPRPRLIKLRHARDRFELLQKSAAEQRAPVRHLANLDRVVNVRDHYHAGVRNQDGPPAKDPRIALRQAGLESN